MDGTPLDRVENKNKTNVGIDMTTTLGFDVDLDMTTNMAIGPHGLKGRKGPHVFYIFILFM